MAAERSSYPMKNTKTNYFAFIATIIFLLASVVTSDARTNYNNDNALKNVVQANVYFDVNLDDSQKLLLRMNLLQQTVQQLREAGLDISIVIGFRGGASRFITRGEDYVLEEEIEDKLKIQEFISRFLDEKTTIEQCSIAADLLDIIHEDFLPGVRIVANGYISLIGYQNQGYAVVSMD